MYWGGRLAGDAPRATPAQSAAMPTTEPPHRAVDAPTARAAHRARSAVVLAGVAGPALLVLGDVVAASSRPGYNALAQPISDLGVGLRPWLLNVPLIACGLSVVVFALTWRRFWSQALRSRLASGFFALFGVCFALAGVLPLSEPGDPHPLRGVLHFVLGFFLGMSALTVALLATSSTLRRHPAAQGHRRYTLATVALVVRVVSRSWDQLEGGEGAVHGPRRPAGCFGDVVSAGEPWGSDGEVA